MADKYPYPDVLKDWVDAGRYTTVDGDKLFVRSAGEADTEGRGVLIVHGFPGSSWDWRGVVPLVAEHTKVVVMDMLGYGHSDKPQDASFMDKYSLFKQADRFEEVARGEGLTDVMLVIHDMGQSVGSELMKRQQEGKLSFHINHAIVFNGSTLINMVQKNPLQESLLAMPEQPLDKDLPWDKFTAAGGLAGSFSKDYPASDETLDAMTAQIFCNDGDRIMPTLIRYMTQRMRELQRWTSGIADFNGPVSMFWGVQDPVSVVAMADTWKMLSPRIELHKWADGAHWPSIENPERVAKIILDRFAYPPY